MNDGLPRSDYPAVAASPALVEGGVLEGLLRSAGRDSKVIFGALKGVFDLNRAQIENFFHVVDQRIHEQNGCKASACEVAIYYNDGASRKFPSINEFNGYSETRNRFPTVLTVHLSYMIQFPGAESVEKQEIDILIRSSDSIAETIEMVESDSQLRMSGDKIQVSASTGNTTLGIISYTINHSRISWGLDLEGHVKSHIEKILSQPSAADRFFQRIAGPLNLFTTVFVGLYIVNLLISIIFAYMHNSGADASPEDLVKLAAKYLIDGDIAKLIVLSVVISGVVFVLFSAMISALTKQLTKPKPSFICLNDGDEKRRESKLKAFERRWINLAAPLLLDIIVGVLVLFAHEKLAALLGITH